MYINSFVETLCKKTKDSNNDRIEKMKTYKKRIIKNYHKIYIKDIEKPNLDQNPKQVLKITKQKTV